MRSLGKGYQLVSIQIDNQGLSNTVEASRGSKRKKRKSSTLGLHPSQLTPESSKPQSLELPTLEFLVKFMTCLWWRFHIFNLQTCAEIYKCLPLALCMYVPCLYVWMAAAHVYAEVYRERAGCMQCVSWWAKLMGLVNNDSFRHACCDCLRWGDGDAESGAVSGGGQRGCSRQWGD